MTDSRVCSAPELTAAGTIWRKSSYSNGSGNSCLKSFVSAGVSRREDDGKKYGQAFTDLQALAPGYKESLSMIHAASKEF